MDPILKYKQYHKNETNIIIHKVCVPILLISAYGILSNYALCMNLFYTINYMIFDVFSKKSIYSAGFLQLLYISSLLLKEICSFDQLVVIHMLSWFLQIIGHEVYEKNTPAFIDNLYDSFLFAPYFVFLEIFYSRSLIQHEQNEQYRIIKQYSIENTPINFISETEECTLNEELCKKANQNTIPTIVYFAGLFQNSEKEYKKITKNLQCYNHVYINVYFKQNDIFSDVLDNIVNELAEENIECVVGYSFGGSLAKQFKDIYCKKTGKDIHSILISPGGFISNTFFEKCIRFISPYCYWMYKNDKWYMILQYPLYQNTIKETDTDIFILSKDDSVHFPKIDENRIVTRNIFHSNMMTYVEKQKIIQQLLETNYDIVLVKTKHVSSVVSKLLYGGHFYPYHVGLWSCVSTYYSYVYMYNQYSITDLCYGGFFASTVWTFTEYIFHRYLLHNMFLSHHQKHHDYPNKKSIIHTPMLLVVLNWFVYLGIVQNILSDPVKLSYYIFFPLNYLAFEYTHLLSHSYIGNNNIIINAKNYHRQHHFTYTTNYSFVTPFWDYLFGTLHPDYSISFNELLFGFLPFYSFMIHDP
jgi:uncharacterized membrane protein YGL010W/sterol desaturase/sphingolipid hydroxylase (fatty acid hydroxylase superfamily)